MTIQQQVLTEKKAWEMANLCNNIEKAIRNEKNEIKRAVLENMLTVADTNYNNCMNELEDDLFDRI
jgi:hypothetical protein